MSDENKNVEQSSLAALQSAVTASDRQSDAQTSRELTRTMEGKLSGSPLILSVLGHLTIMAAEGRDFSLMDTDNNKEFKWLHHPNSFRASLRQVCNANCDALRKAQENMNLVGLKLSAMPEQVAEALQLLTNGTAEEVELLLPINMDNLRGCASFGKDRIKEIVDKFNTVISTLEEMAESCQAAKGGTEESRRMTVLRLKSARQDRQDFEAELESCQEEVAAIKEKLEGEEKALKDELAKAGSAEEIATQFGMKFFDEALPVLSAAALAKGLSDTESAFAFTGYLGKQVLDSGVVNRAINKASDLMSGGSRKASDLSTGASKLLDRVCNPLKRAFKADYSGLDWVALKDKDIGDGAEMELSKFKTKNQPELVDLKQSLETLLNCIMEAKEGQITEEEERKLAVEFNELVEACELLVEPTDGADTTQASAQKSGGNQPLLGKGKSMLEEYLRQKREVVQTWRELLRSSEERKEEAARLEREKRKELQQTLHDLRGFEEREASEMQIIEIIGRALAELDALKQRWEWLLVYFTQMDALVQVTLGDAVTNFISTTEAAKKLAASGNDDGTARILPAILRDRLRQKAFLTGRTAVALELMANTFTSVSERHLKPLVDMFPSFLALDGERDRQKIERKKVELDESVRKAEEDVAKVLQGVSQCFEEKMDKQRAIMGNTLPGLEGLK